MAAKLKTYVTYVRLKGSKVKYSRVIVSTFKQKHELTKHLVEFYGYELAAPPARLTKNFKNVSV